MNVCTKYVCMYVCMYSTTHQGTYIHAWALWASVSCREPFPPVSMSTKEVTVVASLRSACVRPILCAHLGTLNSHVRKYDFCQAGLEYLEFRLPSHQVDGQNNQVDHVDGTLAPVGSAKVRGKHFSHLFWL
jgi:hypothetical protein